MDHLHLHHLLLHFQLCDHLLLCSLCDSMLSFHHLHHHYKAQVTLQEVKMVNPQPSAILSLVPRLHYHQVPFLLSSSFPLLHSHNFCCYTTVAFIN
ncbi:hypothetical protein V6Z12_D08G176400 [Gossypium hirsutum]